VFDEAQFVKESLTQTSSAIRDSTREWEVLSLTDVKGLLAEQK